MSIVTIGDSHAAFGWSGTGAKTHNINSMLCYSFAMEKLNRIDIRRLPIKDGDTIVFCFGEIDCRCHIHKYITVNITYQDIIDDIIKNYMEAILINIQVSGIRFKHVCVYNVVPPASKHDTEENPIVPFLGTDEERKSYILYFNQSIKKKCQEYGFVFFDIYDKYTDENGMLNKKYSDGLVHIKDSRFIQEFINTHLK